MPPRTFGNIPIEVVPSTLVMNKPVCAKVQALRISSPPIGERRHFFSRFGILRATELVSMLETPPTMYFVPPHVAEEKSGDYVYSTVLHRGDTKPN